MFKNFQLVALTKENDELSAFYIPLDQDLQTQLSNSFSEQYKSLCKDSSEIEFDASYKPDSNELFCIHPYELPNMICDMSSHHIPTLDNVSFLGNSYTSVKAIVAFVKDSQNEELVLFQNFYNSYVIKPGRSIIFQSGIYKGVSQPIITLQNKLSAIYIPIEKKLLFKNFRNTNLFLPLADYYKEASNQEIHEILNHSLFSTENMDLIIGFSNQWFRKRFAMLQNSGILDIYSAHQILEESQGHDVHIQLDGDKIIFPVEKQPAKRLLQFLNEELFRGPITKRLFETNSKKEADS
ncbi:hypothetical protein RJ53_07110 [Methanocalculus chunghsingensis]|uniref:DUF4868 domain-containing protein n=1 Tax=Methanocalculus chunghsingensis TaxID=156457 RepID=A0A8J7WAP7_9EURY|nr:DUF4868 domain-containing protein [Methanocalculus chunghsingensis]MBR1369273.1 hypothetical protein [Methanocalculus chunghsingensis]